MLKSWTLEDTLNGMKSDRRFLTWQWVLPIFTISLNSSLFANSEFFRVWSPGISLVWISKQTAICMAVGNVSFELCNKIQQIYKGLYKNERCGMIVHETAIYKKQTKF